MRLLKLLAWLNPFKFFDLCERMDQTLKRLEPQPDDPRHKPSSLYRNR